MELVSEQRHVVQFYNTDEFLCERVADFVGAGLTGGEPIVVIATQAHHEALGRRMRAKGLDVEPACDRGMLTLLDAHDTLARFMVGAMPDWDLFKGAVGGVIEKSTVNGRHARVRAYGELVDVLWRAGNPKAAIRLEEMWNELARTHSFDLLCAYVMGGFYKGPAAEALREVCNAHSHVLPAESSAAWDGSATLTAEDIQEQDAKMLAAEIAHRKEVEQALRQSLRDLRGSEERERAATRRITLLQQATSSLASAITVSDVSDIVLSISENVLGAAASVVYLRDEASGELRLVGSRGVPAAVEKWCVLPLDAPLPVATAIKRCEPVWLESHQALLEQYPNLAPAQTPRSRLQAVAALPLVHAGQLVGGFALSFEAARRFDEDDRQWLKSFASQCAVAAERARLHETHRRLVEELTETVRLNELFAGVLAHDLRNPLGAIMTATQHAMMREERGSTGKLAKPLSRILASGLRMSRMVEQLLDFSRLRLGGGIQLEPRPLDLIPLLRQVMDELADAHPCGSLHLEHAGDTKGVWDEDRLCQVFSNLVGNALQHGRRESGVRVRVDGTDAGTVCVQVHSMGVVPAELVPSLFKPLIGGARRRDKSSGLGLGLFITQQFAKAHGGCIDVESTEEAGTTFIVSLPRISGTESHQAG